MRRLLSGLIAIMLGGGLVACGMTPQEDIANKQWQVTAVFDSPDLPSNAPEGQIAPTIALGAKNYTVNSACGTAQGTLNWSDNSVTIDAPETLRTTPCNPAAQTFHDRYLKALSGDFTFTLNVNGLRFSQSSGTEREQTAQQRGWTAVLAQ